MKDWDALYEECIHCQKCGLAETRTNVVFGEGARDAESFQVHHFRGFLYRGDL